MVTYIFLKQAIRVLEKQHGRECEQLTQDVYRATNSGHTNSLNVFVNTIWKGMVIASITPYGAFYIRRARGEVTANDQL